MNTYDTVNDPKYAATLSGYEEVQDRNVNPIEKKKEGEDEYL